jgi:hypothetical protein
VLCFWNSGAGHINDVVLGYKDIGSYVVRFGEKLHAFEFIFTFVAI